MSNLTRILNNQIYDSTIQAQSKLAAGSITGNLLASSVTFNSNITILGNLSVSGNTSTLNSINTYINDPIVVFNSGYTGSITNFEMGMLINRNYASLAGYGSVQTAWVWVENDQAFEAIATTTSGNAFTTLTNSGFVNIKVGNVTANSLTISTGTITAPNGIVNSPISGSTGYFTTSQATNFSTGNAVITGGYIQGIANVIAGTGNISTLNTTTGNITNLTVAGTLTAGTVNLGTVALANVANYSNIQSTSSNATYYPAFYPQSVNGNAQAFVNSSLTYNPFTNTVTLGTLSAQASYAATGYAANFSSGNVLLTDRKSTRLNSSHIPLSRMPSSA